ncbi:unnamed protein product [Callosobruchus maculatus]|uniref:Uncharacterized protein n=1 Tax=Callosobruchus maculatus TaxID=64391 RepID=A0A653CYQ1_CALMS|nr:unnamed protein product [Callosobruchus maculatus]
MALSQKHSGKVFVPWFNTSEWRKVYYSLHSGSETDYRTALRILKIWKTRTPQLSAGLEGTLIVLQALLLEDNTLEESQITQIYALSIMRFLNLCAANTDRQGTFTRSVEQHDLPKWLADIRHDVAHAHKLPCNEILKVGLETALQWLLERYWGQQFELIQDYEVCEEQLGLEVTEVVTLYARLLLNIHNKTEKDISGVYMNRLNNLIKRKYSMKPDQLDAETIKSVLEETIRQLLSDQSNQKAMAKNIEVLVSNEYMLGVTPEIIIGQIPLSFRNIWIDLLDILNDNNLLLPLLDKLYHFTGNLLMSNFLRHVASLWINEIFKGLLRSRYLEQEENVPEEKYSQIKDNIKFKSPRQLPEDKAQQFEDKVLNSPNEYVFNYLESMMLHNRRHEDYIQETKKLLSKLLSNQNTSWDNNLATLDDLPELIEDDDADAVPKVEVKLEPKVIEPMDVATTRWTLIVDTKAFRGCPLGVLPHQQCDTNPTLAY